MTWVPEKSIPESIITLRSAAASGYSFKVLGEPLTGPKLCHMISDTLGITDEMTTAQQIRDHISTSIGSTVTAPGDLVVTLEKATIAQDDVGLARYLGIDPLRLLMLGHETIAKATKDCMMVRTVPLWRDRKLDRVEIAFTLGKGVTWRNGKLRCARTRLPNTVLDSINGKTLADIVDHDWKGWENLHVERAVQSGEMLVIHTGDQRITSVLAA